MKRVAILHYAAPPMIGGVESTIYHHARLLSGAGYDVRVIAGLGKPFHADVQVHVVPEIGSRHELVLPVGRELAKGQISPAFTSLRDLISDRLGQLLGEVDVAIVHNALTMHKNLALTAALHLLNENRVTRLIAWCHDIAWQDPLYTPDLHPGYPWDLLRTPWHDVRYVVVSEHRRRHLATLLGLSFADIQVVSPGVDVAAFLKLDPATCRLMEDLHLLSASPLVLLPARVTRRKNVEFALCVTADLATLMPDAALVITGPPGPHNPTNAAYLQELHALRDELGIADRVHFLFEHGDGDRTLHVTDAMMSDFYLLADLLLFPSRYEGFGIPVLEAGLARLPVFAADIPSVRESAGDLAYLFDVNEDPSEVAAAIATTLNGNDQYQLRRKVTRDYTWQAKVFGALIPLIEEEHVDFGAKRRLMSL